MIQANELRKGSWVKRNDSNVCVTQILWNRVEVVRDKNGKKKYYECPFEDLAPIELTPESMSGFGFIKHELFPHLNVFYHSKYYMTINIIANTYEVSFGLIAESIAMVYQKNMYLHQLQNLFFSLTNEELTIEFGD